MDSAVMAMLDKDGDGKISASELANVLKRAGVSISDKQLKWIIKIADKDGDGKLDTKELKSLIAKAIKMSATKN